MIKVKNYTIYHFNGNGQLGPSFTLHKDYMNGLETALTINYEDALLLLPAWMEYINRLESKAHEKDR